MTATKILLLLVEDSPGDARLIREMLREAGAFEPVCVDRLSACVERIAAGGIDLVLLDLGLPTARALRTVMAVRDCAPSLPSSFSPAGTTTWSPWRR